MFENDLVSEKNIIDKNIVIKSIAESASLLRNYYKLKQTGYKFFFALDFSEIYAYLFPTSDLLIPIQKQDNIQLAKKIRQWYATKIILENPLEDENPAYWIPPYSLEFSYFLDAIYKKTAGEEQIKNVEYEILKLLDDEYFKQTYNKFINDRTHENFIDIINASDKTSIPLSLIIEFITGSINNRLQRLDDVILKNNLQPSTNSLSSKIFEIDLDEALQDSWKITPEVEEKYKSDRGNYKYRAFIDAFAASYLSLVNKKNFQNNDKTIIILISRSETLHKLSSYKRRYDIEIKNLQFNTYWLPETYLAYRVIEGIEYDLESKNEIYEQKIRNVEELIKISQLNETCVKSEGNKEEINPQKDVIWASVDKLAVDLFNIYLFETSMNKNEIVNLDIPGTNTDFQVFLEIINYYNQNRNDLPKFLNKRSSDLFEKILVTDERLSALSGIETLTDNNYEVLAEKINKYVYWVMKIDGFSFWVKITDIESSLGLYLLKRDKKVTTIETVTKMINDPNEYSYQLNIFIAALNISSGHYLTASALLSALSTSNDYDIQKEVLLLQGAILYLDDIKNWQMIKKHIELLEEFHTRPIMEYIPITKISARIYKMISLLYWKLANHAKDKQYLLSACENSVLAFNRVNQLLGEGKIEEYDLFYINHINNYIYSLTILGYQNFTDQGENVIKLISIIDKFEKLIKENPNRIITNDKYPEIYDTLYNGFLFLYKTKQEERFAHKAKEYFDFIQNQNNIEFGKFTIPLI